MRTVCIALLARERYPGRREAHFRERGVNADIFYGVDGTNTSLTTNRLYELDGPGAECNIGGKGVGIWISHRMLWSALLLLPDEEFFVLEDDVRFPEDWRGRVFGALADAPPDWDMIYVGSCCTQDKPGRLVRGNVHEVLYPFCLHGYLVRKKALLTLIRTQEEAGCYGPIDVTLTLHSLPKLKVYTVIPRVLDQWDMELVP